MKQWEKRKVLITYCDWCQEDITKHNTTHISEYEGGCEYHYCSDCNKMVEERRQKGTTKP
jgi:hypothetical protein